MDQPSSDNQTASVQRFRLKGGEFVADDIQRIPLLPHQVRVQVEYCCLTPFQVGTAKNLAPGAGLVGTVVEAGDAASACQDLRVLVPPLSSCGECDSCRCGFVGACPARVVLGTDIDGGCARSVIVDARWLTPMTNGLELIPGPEAAFIAGELLTAYGLFSRTGTGAGDLALVLGQGSVAGVLSSLAKSRGVTVLRGNSLETAGAAIKEHNPTGKPMRIFVCDGGGSTELACTLASPGSIIATCSAEGVLPMRTILNLELTVLAIPFAHPDLLPESAALVAKGALSVSDFLVCEEIHRQSPHSAQRAFDSGQCLIVHHQAD